MEKQFKYHPLIEGLKVNEDGSEVVYNGKIITQSTTNSGGKIVKIKRMTISVLKLVAECWIGVADSPEYLASRIDEEKGSHYTNLEWRKRGQGVAHKRAKTFKRKNFFKSKKELEDFLTARPAEMPWYKYYQMKNVSETTVRKAKIRYGYEESAKR